MNTQPPIDILNQLLKSKSDPATKSWMEAYMRHQFPFFGVYAPERKSIFIRWYKEEVVQLSNAEIEDLILQLYAKEEREFHYIAAELFYKQFKTIECDGIEHILNHLITQKSWWDTVDFLAVSAAGKWLKNDSELQYEMVNKWIESRNIWLIRTAIIFQLKYKKDTDVKLLKNTILSAVNYKDFFVQKAIGWALREYSKTDPVFTCHFVENFGRLMSSLAVRESLKYLKKKGIRI
ncbi:DNA alkylation repair protein [Schleiferia thermophila]